MKRKGLLKKVFFLFLLLDSDSRKMIGNKGRERERDRTFRYMVYTMSARRD